MAEATPPFRARQRALSYPDDDDGSSSVLRLLVLSHWTIVVSSSRVVVCAVRVRLKGEYLSGHER